MGSLQSVYPLLACEKSMKFWPCDSFEIETTMSTEDIVASLNARVEPRKLLRLRLIGFSSHHAEFEGHISRDGFKITRIIDHLNSFLPVITGRFLPGESGIKIAIRMRLHLFATAFMCVWCGAWVSAGIAVLLSGSATAVPLSVLWLSVLVFVWAMVSGCFWFEAKKQKDMLIQMFTEPDASEQSH